jgi:hypothetical protein
MASYLKLLWQRLSAPEWKVKAEVERIAVLQQTAARCRVEYAEEKKRAAHAGGASLAGAVSSSRARMEAAEATHMAALQIWENKESRQTSR